MAALRAPGRQCEGEDKVESPSKSLPLVTWRWLELLGMLVMVGNDQTNILDKKIVWYLDWYLVLLSNWLWHLWATVRLANVTTLAMGLLVKRLPWIGTTAKRVASLCIAVTQLVTVSITKINRAKVKILASWDLLWLGSVGIPMVTNKQSTGDTPAWWWTS